MSIAPKYIVGNWKMHGDPMKAAALAEAVGRACVGLPAHVETVVCPPSILIPDVARQLSGSSVKTGGQDCHSEREGAYTGDISAPMLAAAGCTHVIVGHSERRINHMESDELVNAKADAALTAGLVPIICVGETQEERDGGRAEDVVGRQVEESIPEGAGDRHFVLAYEPVWAIGSGKTPTADDIRDMHHYIMKRASFRIGRPVAVLYGGSVKAANAEEILAIPGVAGVLVGGASLKAEEFGKIIAAAAALKG